MIEKEITTGYIIPLESQQHLTVIIQEILKKILVSFTETSKETKDPRLGRTTSEWNKYVGRKKIPQLVKLSDLGTTTSTYEEENAGDRLYIL